MKNGLGEGDDLLDGILISIETTEQQLLAAC